MNRGKSEFQILGDATKKVTEKKSVEPMLVQELYSTGINVSRKNDFLDRKKRSFNGTKHLIDELHLSLFISGALSLCLTE